jgi:hypothetical protein
MADVKRVIDRHRAAMVEHPFLTRLEAGATLEQFRRMLPRLAFFVFSFQDVLRLTRELSEEPELKRIAATFEVEDKGHDRWYLRDLEHLGIGIDVNWVFSEEHAVARTVGYRIVSEILSARDDRIRLAVVLSLEAVGREFFVRVSSLAARLGLADGLQYCSGKHLAAELGHGVFTQEGQARVSALLIPEEFAENVLIAVERTFGAMALLAADIDRAMASAGSSADRTESTRLAG